MRYLKTVFALTVFLTCPGAIWAGVSASYSHTTGSNGFDGNTTDANLDLFSGLYVGASYNSYHSDNSSGTINTYYGRLGHYGENGSWKLYGLVTPEVSDYKAVGAGGEFRVTVLGRGHEEASPPTEQPVTEPAAVPSGPPSWHADPRLDLLGSYTRTMYTDQGQKIDENDIMGGLGFNLFKTYLSGTFTKSVYDQEFSGIINPNARRFNIGYAPSIIPGYPDYIYTASVDQTLLPGWWALGSYSYLKFKDGPEDNGNLVSVGTGITLFHFIMGTVMYTWYNPNNNPKLHFFSVGAGLQF